ncbi:MAG TPA: class I SAM-dependent methyltransferase [Candidatus Polarisedimenticolaceae bacterium]
MSPHRNSATPIPARVSPRLAAVASLVPEASRVADVGCDHGELARELLRSARASFVVASDVVRTARAAGGEVDWRVGDGLSPLTPGDRLDVVVLAGMGAATLLRILDRRRLDELGVRRLVVQPQTEPHRVRATMLERGFAVVDEAAAEDAGRFYAAIAFERGFGLPAFGGLEPGDTLAAGPVLLARRDPAARRHWERQRRRLAGLPARAPDLARAERLVSFFARGG